MIGFANDNTLPGLGSAPKGTAGLALSCEQDAEGAAIAVIRPVLASGILGAPLHVARDGTDIIALWRRFGQMMNLPLFALSADGQLEAFGFTPGEVTHPRRGGSPLSGRRTRFARRRQMPVALAHQPEHLNGRKRVR
ncbi:MAG: DUF6101 family protein [Beijerinckiaceae bacterium]|nr:DUF6101 family protein [Beijerinckiaceae bacterium]